MRWNELLNLKLETFRHVPDFIIEKMDLDDNERTIVYFLKDCLNSRRVERLFEVKCFPSSQGFCQLRGCKPNEGFRVSVDVHGDFAIETSHGLMILSLKESVIQSMNEIKELWLNQLEGLKDKELEVCGFIQQGHGMYQYGEYELRAFKGYWKVTSKNTNTHVVFADSPINALLNYASLYSEGFMELPNELRGRIIRKDFKPCQMIPIGNFDEFCCSHHIPTFVYRKFHGKMEPISSWEVLKKAFSKKESK